MKMIHQEPPIIISNQRAEYQSDNPIGDTIKYNPVQQSLSLESRHFCLANPWTTCANLCVSVIVLCVGGFIPCSDNCNCYLLVIRLLHDIEE